MAKSNKGKVIQMLSPENYIRQKARTLPIYECRINAGWETSKMAHLIVARQHTNGNLTTGLYLIDLACLGVKDTFWHFNSSMSNYLELLEQFKDQEEDFIQIDYNLAHNIVFAAIEFAELYNFKPHKDFTSTSRFILEEDTDDIPLIEIDCGVEGLPAYIFSLQEIDAKDRQVIAHLDREAGSGNYYLIDEDGRILNEESDEEDIDDEDWDEEDEEDWDDEDFDDENPDSLNNLDELEFFNIADELDYDENTVQNSQTFQLKISLNGLENPDVWRRITIPSYYSFKHLHDVIQTIFDWDYAHLYQFSDQGFDSETIITDFDFNLETDNQTQLDSILVPLDEILKHEGDRYTYTYDFGDSWEHTIVLEKIITQVTRTPELLEGEGACPPEDCGGLSGYKEMLKALNDKKHPEHREYRDWLDLKKNEIWDPGFFDLQQKQLLLLKLFEKNDSSN